MENSFQTYKSLQANRKSDTYLFHLDRIKAPNNIVANHKRQVTTYANEGDINNYLSFVSLNPPHYLSKSAPSTQAHLTYVSVSGKGIL